MRFWVTALTVVFVLASSAFAGNIALDAAAGGIATATCGATGFGAQTQSCILTTYTPNMAIDGIDGAMSTLWVAPGGNGTGTYVPWLLINLGAVYNNIDFISASSWGHLTFSLYAGTSSNPAVLAAGTDLTAGGTTEAALPYSGAPWTSSNYAVTLGTSVQYVLYYVTASQADSNGHTVGGGWDDASAEQIFVDSTAPEPGTFGLIGAGLLAFGFSRRSRK